jgi:hypothetical protein
VVCCDADADDADDADHGEGEYMTCRNLLVSGGRHACRRNGMLCCVIAGY